PLEPIRLHDVPRLERLEPFEPDTALLPSGHLADVLLEVLQRADSALEQQLPPAVDLRPASTADLALHHTAAGDDSLTRDLDGGDDLPPSLADLPVRRLTQALGRALDV